MKSAGRNQKHLVVEILMQSFKENKSINYIIPKDNNIKLAHLMAYSFELCHKFGKVYLSDDEKACALVLFPERKKLSFWSLFQDLKLILFAIGPKNINKALEREVLIQKRQIKGLTYYLWFIGVLPEAQGSGIGSSLLSELLAEAKVLNRTVCLETSTIKNIPWYRHFGFKIYDELTLTYKLYFLKKNFN